MKQDKRLQHKINTFLDRKTSQYPEIQEYVRDLSRL